MLIFRESSHSQSKTLDLPVKISGAECELSDYCTYQGKRAEKVEKSHMYKIVLTILML